MERGLSSHGLSAAHQNFTRNVVINAVSFFFTEAPAGLFLKLSLNSLFTSSFFATDVVIPMEKFDSESAKSLVFHMVEWDSVIEAPFDNLYRKVSPAITLPDFADSRPESF